MSDNAIYFPYVNVPEGQWLTRVLLFWDKLLSIVPYDYIHAPEQYTPEMRNLLSSGLVSPCIPGQFVGGNSKVADEFLSYVEKQHRQHRRMVSKRSELPSCPVHIEKLDSIAGGLVELGLAVPGQYPWYNLQPWVAQAFMAYLAAVIGKQPNVNAAPVTHEQQSFTLLAGNRTVTSVRKDEARDVILKGVFPRPSLPPTLESLVKFKERYPRELQRLRGAVEEECIRISDISDARLRREAAALASERMEDEIGTVAEAMRVKWGKIVFGSVCSVIGATGGVVSVEQNKPGLTFAAGSALASAVYSAIETLKEHEIAIKEPLAYAALANSRFSIKSKLCVEGDQ